MHRLTLLLLSCTLAFGAEKVRILRDDFGVPHIFAVTAAGAAYGSGYAQAEDRLEELLRNYRKAEGTMSEVFVSGGRNALHDGASDQVPAWAPKIEPWQVVALGRYIIWGWPEGEAGGDLLRAGIQPDPVAYHGSNEWLIAPWRTAMHAPISVAADCGLLSPDLAAGIRRVKGVKKHGTRIGNCLTVDQGKRLQPGCGDLSAMWPPRVF